MHILMTALWPVGGIRTFFRYIYSQEDFRDLKFDLVAPDNGLGDYLVNHLPKGRISLIPCKQSAKAMAVTLRGRLRRNSYQLVHSHGFSAGAVTELAMLGTSVPHMMTAHDVFLPSSFKGIKGKLHHMALHVLYKQLDLVHAVTNDGAQNFQKYMPGLNPARVKPILHGIDAELFANAEAIDIRTRINLPEDALVIGFFGRFMAQKGFRTLVDSIRHIVDREMAHRPVRVLTFGWGGFIREDYQYLREQGLADYFVQMESTDEPQRWMKGVDVVAMPSRWEACGLLAMEVLCTGTPIVGSNCIGLREVLEGSPAAMVNPEDSVALAKALLDATAPGQVEAFREYQPVAIERFSIARPARALRELYDSLA